MLTPKRSLFVKEYLVDLNATQAAIRAGYSAKTASSIGEQLLRNLEIRSAVDSALKKRAEKTEISAEYVIRTIKETIERCKQAVPCVEKIDGEWVPTGEYQFDAKAVLKGAELLGKHLKLFTEQIELSGSVTFIVETGVPRADS